MQVQVTIDDNLVTNLTEGAKCTLVQKLDGYAVEILKEASLIEAGMREREAKSEITSNAIIIAVSKPKYLVNTKSKRGIVALKIASSLTLLTTGFLFSPERFTSYPYTLYLFIISLIATCITTAVLYVKEG